MIHTTCKCIVFLLLLTFSVSLLAQKTRSEVIYHNPLEHKNLIANFDYNKEDQLIAVNIQLCKNVLVTDYIRKQYVLYSGNIFDFYSFLDEIEKFSDENVPITAVNIQGHSVTMPYYGRKTLQISENEGGFTESFRPKEITLYREKVLAWANSRGLPLKPLELSSVDE